MTDSCDGAEVVVCLPFADIFWESVKGAGDGFFGLAEQIEDHPYAYVDVEPNEPAAISTTTPVQQAIENVATDGTTENVATDGTTENVAVDGTASQSSTSFDGDAGRAIDGNTNGDWKNDSVTHTWPNDLLPWWQVELADPTEIDSITLWNRTNCCVSRLTDVSVFVSDTPFADDASISELEADPDVWSFYFDGTIGETTDIPVDTTGRYVRIQKPNGSALSLAEVQIFGAVS